MDRLPALDQRPEQHVGVLHQRDDVLVAVVEDGRDPLEVLEQRVDLLVARGDVADSRATPSRAAWNSSGVLRVRSASVVSDLASWSVSIRSEVSARPENASTTSYGELVRLDRDLAPSSELAASRPARGRGTSPRGSS